MSYIGDMTSRATLPDLRHFARPSDDLEAQASLEADLEDAHRAASLLGGTDAFLTAATLLGAVAVALDGGSLPWALLDAAERLIQDLRLEYGCEDWSLVDWSRPECADVATLDEACRELRQRARELRDERLALLSMREAC